MLRLLVLFTVGLVYAQQPTPCQTPPQWQGKFMRRDEKKNFTEFSDIAYDEYNRRIREVEYLDGTQGREFYDVLYLHNINKEYKINLKDRTCTVSSLTRPFIHFGVPPQAKYVGTANIGPVNIPYEHVTVVLFDGMDSEGGQYYGEVTTPDCVPVTSGFYSNSTGYLHTTFFDITAGIPDPSVFVPPQNCKPA